MDPRDRLRLALIGSGCVRCGQPYSGDGIRVLAQRDEIAFVQLVCFSCQVQTLALVTGVDSYGTDEPDGPEEAEGFPETKSGRKSRSNSSGKSGHGRTGSSGRPDARAVNVDDVIEMRSFLAGYEGDIDGLLNPGREDADDDRRHGPNGSRSR